MDNSNCEYFYVLHVLIPLPPSLASKRRGWEGFAPLCAAESGPSVKKQPSGLF